MSLNVKDSASRDVRDLSAGGIGANTNCCFRRQNSDGSRCSGRRPVGTKARCPSPGQQPFETCWKATDAKNRFPTCADPSGNSVTTVLSRTCRPPWRAVAGGSCRFAAHHSLSSFASESSQSLHYGRRDRITGVAAIRQFWSEIRRSCICPRDHVGGDVTVIEAKHDAHRRVAPPLKSTPFDSCHDRRGRPRPSADVGAGPGAIGAPAGVSDCVSRQRHHSRRSRAPVDRERPVPAAGTGGGAIPRRCGARGVRSVRHGPGRNHSVRPSGPGSTSTRITSEQDRRDALAASLPKIADSIDATRAVGAALREAERGPLTGDPLQTLSALSPSMAGTLAFFDALLPSPGLSGVARAALQDSRARFLRDADATITKNLEGLEQDDRRARALLGQLGPAPIAEVFYGSGFEVGLSKLLRTGLTVAPYFEGHYSGTNFEGKPRAVELAGRAWKTCTPSIPASLWRCRWPEDGDEPRWRPRNARPSSSAMPAASCSRIASLRASCAPSSRTGTCAPPPTSSPSRRRPSPARQSWCGCPISSWPPASFLERTRHGP